MDLGASIRSLSASTSCPDLASRTGSSSHQLQLVQLAHTTLTTNARTLGTSLVPAAAASLDKLIDASAAPLPDSFLDAQDRLEEAVAALGDGLDRFAAELVQQADIVDSVRIELDRVEQEATSLAAKCTPENSPDRELLTDLLAHLEGLGRRLDDVQDRLRALPRPRHPAVPSHPGQTASLVADLESRLSKCRGSLSKASAAADLCRRRFEVSTQVQAALQEMRETAERLETGLAASTAADGRHVCELTLADEGPEVTLRQRLADHEAVCKSRIASLSAEVRHARDVAPRSARLVNACREVNLDASLRQDLRLRADQLRTLVDNASQALEHEEAHRQDTNALAAWLGAFERSRNLVVEAEKGVEERLTLALWREGTPAVDDDGVAARFVTTVDMAVAEMLAHQQSMPTHKLCAELRAINPWKDQARELDVRVSALRVRASLLARAHQQARAVETVVDSVSAIRSRAVSLASRVQLSGARNDPERGHVLSSSVSTDEIDWVAHDFDQVRDGLLARVPFLGSDSSTVQTIVGLDAHDAHVRRVLNELCISTAGLIESTRHSVMAAVSQDPPTAQTDSDADSGESRDLPPIPKALGKQEAHGVFFDVGDNCLTSQISLSQSHQYLHRLCLRRPLDSKPLSHANSTCRRDLPSE